MGKEIEVDSRAKALIFDIDGTLADSMATHLAAFNEVLKAYKVEITLQYLQSISGTPVYRGMELIKERFRLDNFDPIEMGNKKEELYRKYIPTIRPIEPVFRIFNAYYGKMPIACGTGGGRLNAYPTLKALGIFDKVNAVVTCEDVKNGKPAPDTFLQCAVKMGVNPSDCLVFEDADLGIQAAKNGGMMVVDVRPYIF